MSAMALANALEELRDGVENGRLCIEGLAAICSFGFGSFASAPDRNHGRLVLNNTRYFETMCNETTVETMAHSLLELLSSTI